MLVRAPPLPAVPAHRGAALLARRLSLGPQYGYNSLLGLPAHEQQGTYMRHESEWPGLGCAG